MTRLTFTHMKLLAFACGLLVGVIFMTALRP